MTAYLKHLVYILEIYLLGCGSVYIESVSYIYFITIVPVAILAFFIVGTTKICFSFKFTIWFHFDNNSPGDSEDFRYLFSQSTNTDRIIRFVIPSKITYGGGGVKCVRKYKYPAHFFPVIKIVLLVRDILKLRKKKVWLICEYG